MKTYRKKLKDPRWQKMRLSILERDEFSCQICGDGENTLHVHHRYYAPIENPWDYPLHELVTLCESCHEFETAEIMKTYRKKLKDPRWKKMRLSILERDEFSCQICGDGENTLHVHHRYYAPIENPWDYPLHALVTLCENCHEIEGTDMPRAGRALMDRLKEAGAFSFDIEYLAHAIAVFAKDKNQTLPVDSRLWDSLKHVIFWSRTNPDSIRDFIDRYNAVLDEFRPINNGESEG